MSRHPRGRSSRAATDLVLDHDQGRNRLDLESFDAGPGRSSSATRYELERAVVAPPLEYLCEEALDPPAMPGQGRVEEDQPRLLLWWGASHCHVSTSVW